MQLEKYLLKELPDHQISEIETLLNNDLNLKQRLADLEKSNQEILKKYPAQEISKQIINLKNFYQAKETKVKKSSHNYKKYLVPSLGFSAIVFTLFFVFMFEHRNLITDNDPLEINQIKGDEAKLFIYRKVGDKVSLLTNGAKTKENDLLQIAYQSIKNKHGMIFSIDGRGTITLQYPKTIYSSTKLKSTKREALPSSYQLDDAPDFEIFYFVTSEYPIDKEAVLEKAKDFAQKIENVSTKPLPLNKELEQVSFKLIKESSE
jgi:hypothetical protein